MSTEQKFTIEEFLKLSDKYFNEEYQRVNESVFKDINPETYIEQELYLYGGNQIKTNYKWSNATWILVDKVYMRTSNEFKQYIKENLK
jgi:heme oxygenase